MQRRQQLELLTSLRFFAAVAVVLFHYAAQVSPAWPTPIRNIVGNGAAGVPFFFILSGFVLAYTYEGVVVAPSRFWWLRFARIYPTYALSLLVALPVYLSQLRKEDSLGRLPLDVLNRAFLLQLWVPGESLRWNGPAWSLSCEAFFYLLFPAILALLVRPRSKLAVAVVCLAVYSFAPSLVQMATGVRPFLFDTPLRYTLLFAAGVSMGLAHLEGLKLPAFVWYVSAALSAGIPALASNLDTAWAGGLAVFSFALLIQASASPPAGKLTDVLKWGPLVLLGEASYSLYILHEPAGAYLRSLCKAAGVAFDSTAIVLFAAVLVTAGSIVSFLYFEKPMNKALRNRFIGAKDRAPSGTN